MIRNKVSLFHSPPVSNSSHFFLAPTQLTQYLRASYVKPFNKMYLLLEMKVHTLSNENIFHWSLSVSILEVVHYDQTQDSPESRFYGMNFATFQQPYAY